MDATSPLKWLARAEVRFRGFHSTEDPALSFITADVEEMRTISKREGRAKRLAVSAKTSDFKRLLISIIQTLLKYQW